ncbi:MAG: family 78 glycoside hydrolase catalytic domain [Bacteroidales bacterium]|nr:family 78 glycoside hydrolase catalytic domain [Bacteroidales bacterium]
MKKTIFKSLIPICFMGVLLTMSCQGGPETEITNLRVQSVEIPLAIEDANPLFSWVMISSTVGQKQNAYQIVVTRARDNSVVWDSKKVDSGLSNNIMYEGDPLEPETAYTWELTVWDAEDQIHTETSRFETGLMNPDISAWDGARFIGTNSLTLDANSACLFEINADFQITQGDAVSVILGADDFRFSDNFLNIEDVEGENYVRFELDISGVGTETGAILNIYRVGYGKEDSEGTPYRTISAALYPETNINGIITEANKNDVHNMSIAVETGNITFQIDGVTVQTTAPPAPDAGGGFQRRGRGSSITISNYNTGNNYNTFPNLCSVGFAANPGDEAVFTNYRILNKGRSNPDNNVVFGANAGATYSIFTGLPGVTVGSDGMSITVKNDTQETLIGYADPSYGGLSMLRTGFSTASGKSVAGAKLYVTSMGSNEVFINGERVGEDWFGPGDSQFRETLCYYAYDVTDKIKSGSNIMGAILNSGWYTGYMTFSPGNFNFFGDTEALLAKLVITYTDGTQETIVTSPDTWKIYKDGPVRYGSFFQGERYDANKEANISVGSDVNGWSTTTYDDSGWTRPEIVEQRDWIDFDIVARYDQAVRVAEILQAQQVMDVHSEDGRTYTYDMGVNMVGVPSVTIPAGWLQAGDIVILRYGEQVYPGFPGDDQLYIDMYGYESEGKGIAGRILTETYRAALATDFYIAKDSKAAIIQPGTTYRGYQYIQITIPNHEGALPLKNVKGLVLSSDRLPTGTYTATTTDGTTGTMVNQLFKNIQRSQLGNFFTIPTDCPQRNERMGWTGDAQAYTRTGTYNSDARNFFRQWMVALRNDQGVGSDTDAPGGIGSTVPTYNMTDATSFADGTTWAAAVCMVPWQLYIQYGDKQIIEENMETMMLWLNGMDYYDFSDEYTHLSSKTSGLSDWLAMDSHTPADLVNNAIYIYMMEVTAIMAEAIGEDEYAAILKDRHEQAKAEWNAVYVEPESGRTRNAQGTIVHSQTSYATPLNFNTFNDENQEKAQDYLAELAANPASSNTNPDGSDVVYQNQGGGGFGGSDAEANDFLPYTITTGFSGTPNILPALSRAGNLDEAYRMFTCTDFTSWLYPVTMGATSIWERWNGYEAAFGENNQNSMNSFNHFALGAVGQWMYEYQLGITTDHLSGAAGYKHFILQPQAGGNYTSLEGSYASNYGMISSSWTADGQGSMTSYSAVVPANTTATLYLPVGETAENFGETNGVTYVGNTTRNNLNVAQYELSSGKFDFTISSGGITVN